MQGPQTKSEYYARWFKGEFGNKPRTFDTLKALMEDPYDGLLTVRWKTIGDPRLTGYRTKQQIKEILNIPESRWSEKALFTFNESMPDDKLIIQGYLTRTTNFLELHYSKQKHKICNSRHWEDGKILNGLQALLTLQHYVPVTDHEHLNYLLNQYPDSVIEFSTYTIPVGILSKQTIIWEIREY